MAHTARSDADTAALAWVRTNGDKVPVPIPAAHKHAIKRLAKRGEVVVRTVAEPVNREIRAMGIEAWLHADLPRRAVRARAYVCTPELVFTTDDGPPDVPHVPPDGEVTDLDRDHGYPTPCRHCGWAWNAHRSDGLCPGANDDGTLARGSWDLSPGTHFEPVDGGAS